MKRDKEEFNALSKEQLLEKLEFFRRELFQLKLTSLTSHVKDNSQFKKLKRNIARILTLLKFKEMEMVKAS